MNLRRERERGQGALESVDEELGVAAADLARLAAAAAAAGAVDGPMGDVAADPATLEAPAAAVDLVGGVGGVLEAGELEELRPQRPRWTNRPV